MSQADRSRQVVQAAVQSDGLHTRYRKAGSGAPVLLLADPRAESELVRHLFVALSQRFRIIRPDLPDPEAAAPPPCATAWLRGIVDGLGLGRCALVAERAFCLPAAWFALGDPSRAGPLVLLEAAPPSPLGAPAGSEALRLPCGREILLVRADAGPEHGTGSTEEAVRRVVEFLQRAVP